MFRLLMRCSPALGILAILSVVVAALQFVVPLYMMAVYNRILQTKSMESLQLISLIAVVLLIVLGITEIGRSRLLALMAKRIGTYLNHDVYQAILAAPGSALSEALDADKSAPRTQPLNDLRVVSQFVSGGSLNTFFDALLAPVFFLALFILHPMLGWIGLGAGAFIFTLAALGEIIARRANDHITKAEGSATASLEKSLNQYDAVTAMGLADPLYDRWEQARDSGIVLSTRSQSIVGFLSGLAKATRLVVQMGALGVGAWLVISTNTFLAGAIIAASIILGRALAPIDQSISMWRPFVAARQSAGRLVKVLKAVEKQSNPMDVPTPKPILRTSGVTIGFPNQSQPLMHGMDFTLMGGQALGIFGANGTGKTTLLRCLMGLMPPMRGAISLGSTPIHGFSTTNRREYFGYLPQDVQLLPGTIGENITRFDEGDKDTLFAAAEAAAAARFVQTLPMGFATPLDMAALSSGQTQLIGLARAIYGAPVLLAMDEPTANLDAEGRRHVLELIEARKEAGLITVFVSHDDALLMQATHLIQLAPNGERGRIRMGPRDDVITAVKADQQGQKS